jgi:hypothetical protein
MSFFSVFHLWAPLRRMQYFLPVLFPLLFPSFIEYRVLSNEY